MLATDIPDRFPIPFAKNAGLSYIRPIPTNSQIGIQNGAASLNDGFPPLNFIPDGAGGVPPFGEDFNGLLNQMTAWERWFSAGAPVGYNSTFSAAIGGYPKGAVLSAASALGSFWLSTVDNNLSNPDTGGADWVGFTPISMYVQDSGTADAGLAGFTPQPLTMASVIGYAIRVRKISATNTGAYTLNIGFGNTAVVHADSTPLVAGELPASGIFSVVFDGAQFQLQSLGMQIAQNVSTSVGMGPATLASATFTFTHNLGVSPRAVGCRLYLRCDSADAGYSVGDTILWSSTMPDNAQRMTAICNDDNGFGVCNSTTVVINGGINLPNKSTRVNTILTNAKWSLYPTFNVYA